MSVEVIGAGFGRTGTSSLKTALEILGFGRCYHAREAIGNGDFKFWIRVANKDNYDFDEAFNRPGGNKIYKSTCDWPSALYWREQFLKYPNAKIILTIRDPEKWYKSCQDTIFRALPGPYTNLGCTILSYLIGMYDFQKILFNREFIHNNWNKENIIQKFIDHNNACLNECPTDKLLVYEVSQGWEPLCKFLNKPIPSVPFPHENDTAHFQRMIIGGSILGYTVLILPALLLGGLAWWSNGKGIMKHFISAARLV